MLEACGMLKREGVPFRLEMAGDGALREQYVDFVKEHQLQDQVHFCGWIGEDEKADFFKHQLPHVGIKFCYASSSTACANILLWRNIIKQ